MTKAPAGLVDAGASSLATFAAGVAAARLLDSSELGVYAIFFAAWILAFQIPSQLILVPAEANLIRLMPHARAGYLLHNSVMALPAAVLAGLLVLAAVVFAPDDVDQGVVLQLGITAALVAALLPLQDHAKRLFHLSGAHWSAASGSLIRLGITMAVLVIGWNGRVDPGLLPFGSLVAGDLCALGFSLLVAGKREDSTSADYTFGSLIESGKWLLLGASVGPAAGFAGALLVTALADASALGLAEAARVAAQPVLVLAVGLSAVLRPASMEAAVAGNNAEARRLSRRFGLGLAIASIAYVGVVSLPESINPLFLMVPKAFELRGLVALSVAAALFNGVAMLQHAELIALDKTSSLSVAETLASIGRVAVAIPAAVLRSWAIPLGFLIGGLVRWISFSKYLKGSYPNSPDTKTNAR